MQDRKEPYLSRLRESDQKAEEPEVAGNPERFHGSESGSSQADCSEAPLCRQEQINANDSVLQAWFGAPWRTFGTVFFFTSIPLLILDQAGVLNLTADTIFVTAAMLSGSSVLLHLLLKSKTRPTGGTSALLPESAGSNTEGMIIPETVRIGTPSRRVRRAELHKRKPGLEQRAMARLQRTRQIKNTRQQALHYGTKLYGRVCEALGVHLPNDVIQSRIASRLPPFSDPLVIELVNGGTDQAIAIGVVSVTNVERDFHYVGFLAHAEKEARHIERTRQQTVAIMSAASGKPWHEALADLERQEYLHKLFGRRR